MTSGGQRVVTTSSPFILFLTSLFAVCCCSNDNEIFMTAERFQDLASIYLVKCSVKFDPSLATIKLFDKSRNTSLTSYIERSSECKTNIELSSCIAHDKHMVLRVIIVDLTEGETREYGCNAMFISSNADSFTKSSFLNVTRERNSAKLAAHSETVNGLPNTSTHPATGSHSQSSFSTNSGTIDSGIFFTVLAILISLLVIFSLFVLLYFRKKFKQVYHASESDALSYRGGRLWGAGNGNSLDKDVYSLAGTYAQGVSIYSSTGSSTLPNNARQWSSNSFEVQYPKPISVSSTLPRKREENQGHLPGSSEQYHEPWGHLDNEIVQKLGTLRPNPRMCHVPGFEASLFLTDAEIPVEADGCDSVK